MIAKLKHPDLDVKFTIFLLKNHIKININPNNVKFRVLMFLLLDSGAAAPRLVRLCSFIPNVSKCLWQRGTVWQCPHADPVTIDHEDVPWKEGKWISKRWEASGGRRRKARDGTKMRSRDETTPTRNPAYASLLGLPNKICTGHMVPVPFSAPVVMRW